MILTVLSKENTVTWYGDKLVVPVQFDIKRDNALIATGTHFWCKACAVAKPLDDQSPDPRYCLRCYDSLKDEASLLTGRPAWVPKTKNYEAIGMVKVSGDAGENMHTVNGVRFQSVHNSFQDIHQAPAKRGPKSRELPDDLINKWAGEGMGSKAISYQLKRELGITVHYSTIQRRLKKGLAG